MENFYSEDYGAKNTCTEPKRLARHNSAKILHVKDLFGLKYSQDGDKKVNKTNPKDLSETKDSSNNFQSLKQK